MPQGGALVGNAVTSCAPSSAGGDVHATLPEETQRLLASVTPMANARSSLRELTSDRLLASALSKPGWRSEVALPRHVRSFGCIVANGFVYVLGGFSLDSGHACAQVWRARTESLVMTGDVMEVWEGQPAELWPSEHELMHSAAELFSSKYQGLVGPSLDAGADLEALKTLAQRVADRSLRAASGGGSDQAQGEDGGVNGGVGGDKGAGGGGEGSGQGLGDGGVDARESEESDAAAMGSTILGILLRLQQQLGETHGMRNASATSSHLLGGVEEGGAGDAAAASSDDDDDDDDGADVSEGQGGGEGGVGSAVMGMLQGALAAMSGSGKRARQPLGSREAGPPARVPCAGVLP